MKKHQHLSFANVTSLLALFVALSGSAYAIGKKTVGTKQLKPNAVTSPKVKNASLLGKDFAPGQLPAGPPGQDASSPAGAVSFFNLAACPSGWTELAAAQGRYIVGVPAGGTIAGVPVGGTLAGTVGTALTNLENRPVGQHNHSITDRGHTHLIYPFTGGTDSGTGDFDQAGGTRSALVVNSERSATGITIDSAGNVAGTNAPYIQLRVCQKS